MTELTLDKHVDCGFPIHGHGQVLLNIMTCRSVHLPEAGVMEVAEEGHQFVQMCLIFEGLPGVRRGHLPDCIRRTGRKTEADSKVGCRLDSPPHKRVALNWNQDVASS